MEKFLQNPHREGLAQTALVERVIDAELPRFVPLQEKPLEQGREAVVLRQNEEPLKLF